jgi:hypothetical protein
MELGHLVGERSTQLEAQEVGKQLVVAKPGSLPVQRDDERVRVLQLEQDSLRVAPLREQVGKLAVHAGNDRSSQQHPLDLDRLVFQHLGEEVLADGAVAAGELVHEAVGIGVCGERDRRQAHPGRPTFGARPKRRCVLVREGDAGRAQHFTRLALGEPQLARTDFADLTGETQPVQSQPRVSS